MREFMDEQLKSLQMPEASQMPDRLAGLDDRILDAMAVRRRESEAMKRMMVLAAFISLGGGIFAGAALPGPAVAASPTPLVPANPLTQVMMAEAR